MPACWHIMLVTLEGQVMGNNMVFVKNYKYIFIYEDKYTLSKSYYFLLIAPTVARLCVL